MLRQHRANAHTLGGTLGAGDPGGRPRSPLGRAPSAPLGPLGAIGVIPKLSRMDKDHLGISWALLLLKPSGSRIEGGDLGITGHFLCLSKGGTRFGQSQKSKYEDGLFGPISSAGTRVSYLLPRHLFDTFLNVLRFRSTTLGLPWWL